MVPSKTHQLSLFPYRVGGGADEGFFRGATPI